MNPITFTYYGKPNDGARNYRKTLDPTSPPHIDNECEYCKRRKSIEHKEWDSDVDEVLRMYYVNMSFGTVSEKSLEFALHSFRMYNSMDFEKEAYIRSQVKKRIQNKGEK